MEKKLVLTLPNHNVYYVKNEDINYYITIPKNEASTNICIELKNRMGENNIKVDSKIILVNNDKYKTFINWFITKYKERVMCKNLLELVQFYNANATSYKKLETPVMNFVVGSYNTEVTAPKIEPKVEEKTVTIENKQPQVSYGYATYWILAIVTLVVSSVVAIIAFTMK